MFMEVIFALSVIGCPGFFSW